MEKKEGRNIHVTLFDWDFDWQYYLNEYPDLRANGIHSEDQAIKHWIIYGKKEERKAFQEPILYKIIDENNNIINTSNIEFPEQVLANRFIFPNDVVLELGARYGSVSCIINSKLNCKTNQVVVEPDDRVWEALEINKIRNNCNFNIIKGFISNKKLSLTNLDISLNGYGSTFTENNETNIPSYSLNYVKKKYNLDFNVIVADCEGFLEVFFDENPTLYDTLRMIIFEEDYPEKCNYQKIKKNLFDLKFKKIVEGHQNVWIK